MAKMIDKEPKYEGEKKVWHYFYKNLPSDWVVYNTRSINGREYDFCVISPNMGLFIVEVKGWNPDRILNVINANTIFLAGAENPEDDTWKAEDVTVKASAVGNIFPSVCKISILPVRIDFPLGCRDMIHGK